MYILNPTNDSPMALDVPCIALLITAPGAPDRYYGPFANLLEARDWVDAIHVNSPYMSFQIIPLRRTDKERNNDDWYGYNDIDFNDFFDEEAHTEKLLDAESKIIDV